jgi:hypothetical protein
MTQVWKDGQTVLARSDHELDLIKKRRDETAHKYALQVQTGRIKRLEVE